MSDCRTEKEKPPAPSSKSTVGESGGDMDVVCLLRDTDNLRGSIISTLYRLILN